MSGKRAAFSSSVVCWVLLDEQGRWGYCWNWAPGVVDQAEAVSQEAFVRYRLTAEIEWDGEDWQSYPFV